MRPHTVTTRLSFSPARRLGLALAACTLLISTVATLSATSPASATTTPSSSALTTTVPFTVTGEPLSSNGDAGFNVELTNTTPSTCTLSGWPTLSVAVLAPQPPITVTDVTSTDIAAVQPAQLALTPGSSAVFTVVADNRSCISVPWTLDLALSSGGTSNAVETSVNSRLCLSPTLYVSPYYPLSTFTSLVTLATTTPSSVSPYATATGPEPSTCTPSDATATVVSSSIVGGMSTLVLRLQATGGASCSLSGLYPLVQLTAGSLTEAAKVWYSGPQPAGITTATFGNFGTATNPRVATVLSGSPSVYVTVVAQSTPSTAPPQVSDGSGGVVPISPSQCITPLSLTIFGTAYAVGTGLQLTLPASPTLCGQPEEFTYTASPLSSASLSSAASALSSSTGVAPLGDSPAGFYYGSDGTFTYTESPVGGYYKEP